MSVGCAAAEKRRSKSDWNSGGRRGVSRRLGWGKELGPSGRDLGRGLAQKKMIFSLEMACFGEC